MTNLWNKLKSDKAYVLGFLVPSYYVLLFFLAVILFYGLRSWINQDKWQTLVHEQYRFSVDYPANWKYRTFGERGYKNLHDLKVTINSLSLGPFGPSRALWVYWVSLDNPTLTQASEWGLTKLPQHEGTISNLQETYIGTEPYPALVRTFHYTNNSQIRIHYYVVRDNGAYLLEFYLKDRNDEAAAAPIFEQMLASFYMFD
jgi:hypothetical protein